MAPLLAPSPARALPKRVSAPPSSGLAASPLAGARTRPTSSCPARPSSHAPARRQRGAWRGAAITEEHMSSSSVPSSGKAIRSVTAASPLPSSSLAPRTAATLGSRGDQSILGRAAVLQGQTAWRDVERRLMQEMPGVFTKGLPNGNRVQGFLYKYRELDDVRIICICHGSFVTPLEFVQHAGAGNDKVDNPLRHIVMSPTQTL